MFVVASGKRNRSLGKQSLVGSKRSRSHSKQTPLCEVNGALREFTSRRATFASHCHLFAKRTDPFTTREALLPYRTAPFAGSCSFGSQRLADGKRRRLLRKQSIVRSKGGLARVQFGQCRMHVTLGSVYPANGSVYHVQSSIYAASGSVCNY